MLVLLMMIRIILLIIITINAPLSSCHGIPSCPVCVTLILSWRTRRGEGVWTRSSTIHCTYHRSIPNLLSHDLRPIKASARQPRVIAPNMRIMNEYIIIYYITYILYIHANVHCTEADDWNHYDGLLETLMRIMAHSVKTGKSRRRGDTWRR